MKLPMPPPTYESLSQEDQKDVLATILAQNIMSQKHPNILTPALSIDKKKYLHWDKLRHLEPPRDMRALDWWFVIKFVRKASYKQIPFVDKHGKPFVFNTPDLALQKLRFIDRNTGNIIQNPNSALNTPMRDDYLIQSLIEEAITSSQLEGASTTRRIAKEMLRTERKPRNLSEQMIFNNYQAMQFIHEIKNEKLSLKIILELQRIITQNTLNDKKAMGRLRKSKDEIQIVDHRDNRILYVPPKAEQLPKRLEKLCDFANTEEDKFSFFIHPVIKAIILHFMLAYEHPFVDGNGRTARALFYWCMAQQGYSLMEFISISQVLKKQAGQYARAFLYTETDENDLTYFIYDQLDVIIKAINIFYEHIKKQSREIHEAEALLYANPMLQNKLNYRQITLIKHALKHQHTFYQILPHQKSHNISYDTARNDLLKLSEMGLLVQQKIGKAFNFTATPNLKEQIKKLKQK